MCNAWNHSGGCACGFGPPYEPIGVEIRYIRPRLSNRPGRAADLGLRFPSPSDIDFWALSDAAQERIMKSLQKAVQRVANKRFGPRVFRAEITAVRPGSVDFVTTLMVASSLVTVFGGYKAFKESIREFANDLRHASRRLRSLLQKACKREFKRESSGKPPKERKGI